MPVVQDVDSFYAIATANGMDPHELAALGGKTIFIFTIHPGDVLEVSGSAQASSPTVLELALRMWYLIQKMLSKRLRQTMETLILLVSVHRCEKLALGLATGEMPTRGQSTRRSKAIRQEDVQ